MNLTRAQRSGMQRKVKIRHFSVHTMRDRFLTASLNCALEHFLPDHRLTEPS